VWNSTTRLTAVTNTTGYAVFSVSTGTYWYNVTANGYRPSTGQVTVTKDTVFNVPLLASTVNESSTSILLVKARYSDGFPLEGAKVTVNGVLVGYTDSYGELALRYPWGSTLSVTVSYGNWSDTKTVSLGFWRVVATFIYPYTSQYFKPEVALTHVTGIGWFSESGGQAWIEAYGVSFASQNITIRLGAKYSNGTVAGVADVSVNVREPGSFVARASVKLPGPGTYIPFANITAYKYDYDTRNNYVEGKPFKTKVSSLLLVYAYVKRVVSWGEYSGTPLTGIYYPGKTVITIGVNASIRMPLQLNTTLVLKRFSVHPASTLLGEYRKAVSITTQGPTVVQLAEFNVTLPESRFMNVSIALNTSLGDDYIVVTTLPLKIDIGPHFVLKEARLETPAVPVGSKITVVVTSWNNYLPGEPTMVTTFLELKIANSTQSTIIFDAFNFTPGATDARRVDVSMPKSVALSPTTPYADADAVLTLGATADSFAGDNSAQFTVRVLNASSWVTWLLLLVAAAMIILFVVLLVGARASRVASAVSARSPFLE
jgi:hypothetical protein